MIIWDLTGLLDEGVVGEERANRVGVSHAPELATGTCGVSGLIVEVGGHG